MDVKLSVHEIVDLGWALKKASEVCQFADTRRNMLDLHEKINTLISSPQPKDGWKITSA